jgi:DNA-binding MarR family transcriptional regulator
VDGDDLAAEQLAALEHELVAFVRAFGLLQSDATPCGEPIPVSEAHAVTALAASGSLTQGELIARLNLTKGTVSRIVRLLGERGWVERRRSDTDARIVRLRLTKAGEAAARRLSARRQQKLAAMLAAVPLDERQRVVDALAILAKASDAAP